MKEINFGKLYLKTALVLLFITLIFGCLAGASYIWPGFLKDSLGFISMRPIHVSAALFWILLGATACVYFGLNQLFPNKINTKLAAAQYALWVVAMAGIFYSYLKGEFGGREYWEFNPIWAVPIALAWLLFVIQFLSIVLKQKNWPVYYYMWMTGIVFFLYIFIENYLWLIPYFKQSIVKDMAIQWKVNGSLVGAWNQILYGTAFFLMDRITGNSKVGFSKLAFTLYFIGFFNMLFNWSHHIYTLPTADYIRYVGYIVSMTEWVFFLKTVYTWKSELNDIQKYQSFFPYQFLMAANFWVFVNLIQALLMSIPAINLYTHGTHITVAHAMGTTIGINSMFILAAAFYFYGPTYHQKTKGLNIYFWTLQLGILLLWLGLIVSGLIKGMWQMAEIRSDFASMMLQLKPWIMLFYLGGLLATIGFSGISSKLLFGSNRTQTN